MSTAKSPDEIFQKVGVFLTSTLTLRTITFSTAVFHLFCLYFRGSKQIRGQAETFPTI